MNQENLSEEIEGLRRRVVELEARLKSNETEAAGLRVSESRYRQAVEESPNPIMAIDSEGRILSWNRVSTEVTGYSLSEAIGNPLPSSPPHRDGY